MNLIEDARTSWLPRYDYIANTCAFPDTITTAVPNTVTTTTHWRLERDLLNAISDRWELNAAGDVMSIYCKHDANEVLKAAEAPKEKERARMGEIIWPEVKKIEILKENKVVRVTINNKSYKQIRKYGDTFDLRVAVAIGLVKNMWDNLTPEGNEYYARHFLLYHKDFNKVVDRAIKAYEREKREKELEEHRKEEIKKIKERRRAKNAMKRKKRREAAARKDKK